MTRGVLLFAHNNGVVDYYRMAAYTASRIERFLKLPTSIVTDENSITSYYAWDHLITRTPDTSNRKTTDVWINKGRYQAYELSPYDDTIVLDTDYLINSNRLLQLFEYPVDFMCHYDCHYLMTNAAIETVGRWGSPTMWATVLRFQKSHLSESIFNMMRLIQTNYQHYSNIYNFQRGSFRNDYALTIALRTVCGQLAAPHHDIPWKLLHVSAINTRVERCDDTSYKIHYTHENKTTHIMVKDTDFHMMSKENFEVLM